MRVIEFVIQLISKGIHLMFILRLNPRGKHKRINL